MKRWSSRLPRLTPAIALAIGLTLTLTSAPRGAASAAGRSDAPCETLREASWSSTELFIWQNVCARRASDLSDRRDPTVSPHFLETILTTEPYRSVTHTPISIDHARFIEQVELNYTTIDAALWLTNSEFSKTIDLSGIQARDISLRGSTVHGDINLADSQIAQSVDLQDVLVTGGISLARARIGVNVELDRARTAWLQPRHRPAAPNDDDAAEPEGRVDFGSADVRSIHIRNGKFRDVNLTLAHLNGQLVMNHSTMGLVSIDGAQIAQNVIIDDSAHLRALHLTGSHIAGQLSLRGATVGPVVAENVIIDGPAFLIDGQYKDVDLNGGRLGASITIRTHVRKLSLRYASIGAYALFEGMQLDGDCACDQLQISGNLALQDSRIAGAANFAYLSATGSFRLTDGSFRSLDLAGAKIGGDVVVSSGRTQIWREGGTLVLRNAVARAFDDRNADCPRVGAKCADPWPKNVDANGFTYQQLGALSSHPRVVSGSTPADAVQQLEHLEDPTWWHMWLGKEDYSPERYAQAASILRQSGHPDAATRVLFDGKDQEYAQLSPGIKKVFLFLSRSSIGYGYYPGRAVWFVLGFLIVGVIVLWRSPERKRLESVRPVDAGQVFPLWGFVYSFDMLIPVLTLRKADGDIELKGGSRLYFYVHRSIGFLLATFLLAGLTGLTK